MNTPKINKRGVETAKTVLIAVLVTAIVAFIGGMTYQSKQQTEVKNAVSAAQVAAPAVAATPAPTSK